MCTFSFRRQRTKIARNAHFLLSFHFVPLLEHKAQGEVPEVRGEAGSKGSRGKSGAIDPGNVGTPRLGKTCFHKNTPPGARIVNNYA